MRFVPKGERTAWHEKAMATSRDGDLAALIGLWLATLETSRLVERLRVASDAEIEALSHYTSEPAANHLARKHPDVAAKLYRAMGMRIVNKKKSKYYDAALRHLEQAKQCYMKTGLADSWNAVVDQVRREHHRKTAFISRFEQIVAGAKRRPERFLVRARKRWNPGRGR